MKVKELIAKLQEYDGELEVVVDGYEGGVDYPRSVDEIEIARSYYFNDKYYGSHREVEEGDKEKEFGLLADFIEEGGIVSKVIIIRR